MRPEKKKKEQFDVREGSENEIGSVGTHEHPNGQGVETTQVIRRETDEDPSTPTAEVGDHERIRSEGGEVFRLSFGEGLNEVQKEEELKAGTDRDASVAGSVSLCLSYESGTYAKAEATTSESHRSVFGFLEGGEVEKLVPLLRRETRLDGPDSESEECEVDERYDPNCPAEPDFAR